METIRFDYKGYYTICKPNPNDRGRLYGDIYSPDNQAKPLSNYGFASDTKEEAQIRFESIVRTIIHRKEFAEKQELWLKTEDHLSIGYVLDIMPKEFLERIKSKQLDKSLIDEVKYGDYKVPLYYVTKAWDVLLKRMLGIYADKIGPEEDYDGDYTKVYEYPNDLKEYIKEWEITRTRDEAIAQNDEMKVIWKKEFGIDIDELIIDFTQFNMHIPPQVSKDRYEGYFFDPNGGVDDWILDGINYPSGECTFDKVSALMEFVAMMKYEFPFFIDRPYISPNTLLGKKKK